MTFNKLVNSDILKDVVDNQTASFTSTLMILKICFSKRMKSMRLT